MSGLFLVAAASQSTFAENNYPTAVKKAISSYAADCEGFGKFTKSPKFIRIVDLKGDGSKDYILDTGEIGCTESASMFTGNSGGSILIFSKTKDGDVKKVFDEFKEEVFLKNNQLSLSVRGDECGIDTSKMSRAADSGCLRQVDWNPVKQKMEFGKILKVY